MLQALEPFAVTTSAFSTLHRKTGAVASLASESLSGGEVGQAGPGRCRWEDRRDIE